MKKRYKIVFTDCGTQKVVYGEVNPDNADPLLKVYSDKQDLIYINKENIIFMRELG